MKVVVTGASGLIGTALVGSLVEDGHRVVSLTRRPAATADEVTWDPRGGALDPRPLEGVDAVVHLAGAGVGDKRWTAGYKREIRDSRVLGTRTLVTALNSLPTPPRVLVCAGGVAFYGSRGDEILTEQSSGGGGFLAGVVRAWEAEAGRAGEVGTRVVTLRNGLVVSRHGGAFGRLSTLIRLGAAGPIGNGRQWWPWITLVDEVNAIRFLLDHDEPSGPVNVAAPVPERQRDLIRTFARAMHRPALLPAPAFALHLVLGGFAGEILASQRVVPQALIDAGFEFTHPTLSDAAPWFAERT